jgi:hypothetical protein
MVHSAKLKFQVDDRGTSLHRLLYARRRAGA